MPKYKVVDLYEGKIFLGYANNMDEIKRLAQEQYDATDGECKIYYYPLNKVSGKYKISEMMFLECI